MNNKVLTRDVLGGEDKQDNGPSNPSENESEDNDAKTRAIIAFYEEQKSNFYSLWSVQRKRLEEAITHPICELFLLKY